MMSVMMQAATETAGKGATMTSESISSALEMIKSIVSWVVSFVADNAVLMVFFVAGLIPVGIMVFRKLKNAVRQDGETMWQVVG